MFETDRLHMRPFTLTDVAAFHSIWGDPEVIWWGANETLEDSRLGLEGLLARHATWDAGLGWFAVMPKGSDDVVGDVILQPAKFVDGVEIGWHFRRDAWGNGYATEAAKRVLAYAFEDLSVDPVYAIVATQNEPSLRVTEKLGLKRVREMEYANLPHVLFALDAP